MPGAYPKQGYLLEDFHIFSLKDQSQKFYPYHYHDFYKLLIFIREMSAIRWRERNTRFGPADVSPDPGEIHRAIIHDDSVYSRLIIYLSARIFPLLSGRKRQFHPQLLSHSGAEAFPPDPLLRGIRGSDEPPCQGAGSYYPRRMALPLP